MAFVFVEQSHFSHLAHACELAGSLRRVESKGRPHGEFCAQLDAFCYMCTWGCCEPVAEDSGRQDAVWALAADGKGVTHIRAMLS